VLGSLLQPFRLLSTEAQAGCQTFNETGKTVCGRFLDYWKTHGGLAQQGYPITNEFQEVSDLNSQTYTVQYFERAVFEKHPENAAPNDVLLSQLGTFQLQRKYPGGDPSGGAPPPQPPAQSGETFTFNGTTTTKTDQFHLAGGNYKASWKATASQYGCYIGASLKATDPNLFVFETIANATVAKNETRSDSTNIYGLKAGDYYIDVLASTCQSWSITVNK
jgi:hypothetical protein